MNICDEYILTQGSPYDYLDLWYLFVHFGFFFLYGCRSNPDVCGAQVKLHKRSLEQTFLLPDAHKFLWNLVGALSARLT